MKTSEKIDKLIKSMISFRSKLEQPKTVDNPFYNSKYVNLESIIDAADLAFKGLASEDGLTFTQELTSDVQNQTVSVSTTIFHVSGQMITYGPYTVPVGKNNAQGYGSSGTYAKRQSLSAALGITSDADDDGNYSSTNNQQQQGYQNNNNQNSYNDGSNNYSNSSKKNKQNQKKSYSNNQSNNTGNGQISNEMFDAIRAKIKDAAHAWQSSDNDIYDVLRKKFDIKDFNHIDNNMAQRVLVYLNRFIKAAKDQSKVKQDGNSKR